MDTSSRTRERLTTVIHSFRIFFSFYSASSSPLLLRGTTDYIALIYCVGVNTAKCHRQLRVKDLPKVQGLVLVCSDERKCGVMKGCLCSDELRRNKWCMQYELFREHKARCGNAKAACGCVYKGV